MWWVYPVSISTAVGLAAATVCMFLSKEEKEELEESNE